MVLFKLRKAVIDNPLPLKLYAITSEIDLAATAKVDLLV